jgi:dihydrofolate reductase
MRTDPTTQNMSSQPTVSLIAAVARNGAIGKNGALLWTDPEDMKHFRRVTMGCPVIMGRKTWDSLPERFRPLPGRRNIVVTRNPQWQATGAEQAPSMIDAIDGLSNTERIFVIGGAQMYALALPLAYELLLTEIDADLPGDTFFPMWRRRGFEVTSREPHVGKDGVGYSFVTYTRTTGD